MKNKFFYLLITLVSLVAAFFLDSLMEPRNYEPINISFEIKGENENVLQIFYTENENEEFNEKQSIQSPFVDLKSSQRIDFSLPISHLCKLRVDFGYRPERLQIKDFLISANEDIHIKDFETNVHHNMMNVLLADLETGLLSIESSEEDPFIAFLNPMNINASSFIQFNYWKVFTFFLLSFAIFFLLFRYFIKHAEKVGKADLFMVIAFFVMLLIPNLKINKDKISTEENRVLAPAPKLIQDKKLNEKYGSQFEQWYNDRFFCRDQLIKSYSNLYKAVNKDVRNDQVFQGKDNWLFYILGDGMFSYANTDQIDGFALNNILTYLQSMNDWCEQNGKKFYCMICPSKNKIYSEYYKYTNKIYPDSKNRTSVLTKAIKERTTVKVLYPSDVLIEKKKSGNLLYFKNDTHWNSLGAYYAYSELIKLMSQDFHLSPIEFTKISTYKYEIGDLSRMHPAIERDVTTVYQQPCVPVLYTEEEVDSYIQISNPNGEKRLFWSGDSFGEAMRTYIGATFEQVTIKKKFTYKFEEEDLSFIKESADIVVLQFVERNIPIISYLSFLK